MSVETRWADDSLAIFGKKLARLNREFPKILPQELNKVGNLAKTQVIRALTKQTGLPRKTIAKAVGNPATAKRGKLSYEMVTRGGNIRLKYLNPKETAPGVVAKPFGKSTLYPGTFMKGGAFGNRKTVAEWKGHVMFRNGTGRHIAFARSGVVIPVEMQTGSTIDAFNKVASPLLQQRIGKAIDRLIG